MSRTAKLFLSREDCISLGMITPNFPTVGEVNDLSTNTVSDDQNSTGLTSNCDCPRRELPPTLATKLPFPATITNRKELAKVSSRAL